MRDFFTVGLVAAGFGEISSVLHPEESVPLSD